MRVSIADRVHYYGSRIYNKIAPTIVNKSGHTSASTILLTAGFNGNLGDQALLTVSRRACIAAGGRPFATSYHHARFDRIGASTVVMAGGEIGDLWHFQKLIEIQPDPALTRISSLAFSNTFLRSPCPHVVAHLRQMSVIHVRDKSNAQAVRETLGLANVTCAPDITFSLYKPGSAGSTNSPSVEIEKSRRRVVINVQAFFCNYHRTGSFVPCYELAASLADSSPGFILQQAIDGYISAIGHLVRHHVQKGDDVCILSFGPVDTAFARVILNALRLRVPIFASPWAFERTIDFLSGCDLIYASRYHAHIAGLLAQTPTISITLGKKNEGLCLDLGIDLLSSSVRREEFMDPNVAFDSLLGKQPFVISTPALESLSAASRHALDSCYHPHLIRSSTTV
jgi:Polysaccharide pyruvyl transferase